MKHFSPGLRCPRPGGFQKRLLKLRYNNSNLCARHNTPGADLVVGVTGEQGATSSSITIFDLEKKSKVDELKPEFVEKGKKSRDPESVDLIASGERVEVLGLVKVPEHGGTVLATGGAEEG
jgi:hypothetical protein